MPCHRVQMIQEHVVLVLVDFFHFAENDFLFASGCSLDGEAVYTGIIYIFDCFSVLYDYAYSRLRYGIGMLNAMID